jgi:hypothetical protein
MFGAILFLLLHQRFLISHNDWGESPFYKGEVLCIIYLRYFKSVSAKADLLFLGLTDLKSSQSLAPPVKESLAVFDTNTAPVSGTYGQSGTTVTVADTGHGLSTGDVVGIDFSTGTGGTACSGNYSITVTTADAFTVTMLNSDTITGSPACVYVANDGPSQKKPKRWLMSKSVAANDAFANVFSVPNSGFVTTLGVYFVMTNLLEADMFYE